MPEHNQKAIILEVEGTALNVIFSIHDERVHVKSIRIQRAQIGHLLKDEIIEEITAKLAHDYTNPTA
jgi:hypothetical protein